MTKRKKGAKEAQSELMKMLANKDGYIEKLKKHRDASKARVDEDNKRKHKSKPKRKDTGDSAFMQELKNVGPEFMHGVRREYKQIKSMFKKDKKDK